jgi:hypothetical protein
VMSGRPDSAGRPERDEPDEEHAFEKAVAVFHWTHTVRHYALKKSPILLFVAGISC